MYESSRFQGRAPMPRTGPIDYTAVGNKNGGIHFLQDDAPVDVQRPEWNTERVRGLGSSDRLNTTHSWTYFRILPTRDDNDPSRWAPSGWTDEDKFGQWFPIYSVFDGGDFRRVRLILWDPMDDGYQRRNNPAVLLRNSIKEAVDNNAAPAGSKWDAIVYSDHDLKKRGAPMHGRKFQNTRPLPWDEHRGYVRALILRRGIRDLDPVGLSPGDKVPMLELRMKSSVGEELRRDVIRTNCDTSLAAGRFHLIYRSGDDPDDPDSIREPFKPGGGYSVKSYERMPSNLALTPDLRGEEAVLFDNLPPFNKIFKILDDESQAELLAAAFQHDALVYGWRSRPELVAIADAVHKRKATVEFPPPAAAQPPSAVPPAAPPAAPPWRRPVDAGEQVAGPAATPAAPPWRRPVAAGEQVAGPAATPPAASPGGTLATGSGVAPQVGGQPPSGAPTTHPDGSAADYEKAFAKMREYAAGR